MLIFGRLQKLTYVYAKLCAIIGKKMAAVHFTTITCEPNTARRVQGRPYFCSIFPCANDTVYSRFEGFRTFGCIFYERYLSFRALRIKGNGTNRHRFSYGGLELNP